MVLSRQFGQRALWSTLVVFTIIPLLGGCVSRKAPFDALDDAQTTILRLSAQQTPQATMPPVPTGGIIPGLPGLTVPPELQALCQQVMQGVLKPWWPQGMPSPCGTAPGAVTPTQQRVYKNQWGIISDQPLFDEAVKDELLDIFGSEDSFNANRPPQCTSAGMAVVFSSHKHPEPIEVVVSLSCNQAWAYGFQWPHPQSGFTHETKQALTIIYEKLFGPVPPDA